LFSPTPSRHDSNEYRYEALKDSMSIRLLKLRAKSCGPLFGEIHQFRLKDVPKFRALSYVWGPPLFDWDISCSGQALRITQNLYEALNHLRSQTVDLWLWADAICINQQDAKERGEQVKLMAEIYHHSDEVLIWIGPDKRGIAKSTFDLLRKTRFQFDSLRQTLSSSDWRRLIYFFASEWFRRVWIFQEAVLARSAYFCWGTEQIHWKFVAGQANRLHNSIPGIWAMSRKWKLAERSFHLTNCMATAKIGVPELSVVLGDLRNSACADDRDRIYGVLALTSLSLRSAPVIKPEYTKSIDEVYYEFAQKTLETEPSLGILTSVHHQRTLEKWSQDALPSWVPYWNSGIKFSYFAIPIDAGLSKVKFQPTAPLSQRFQRSSPNQKSLFLDGFVYSTVKICCKTALERKHIYTGVPGYDTIRAWRTLVKHFNHFKYQNSGKTELRNFTNFAIQFHDALLAERQGVKKDMRYFFQWTKDPRRAAFLIIRNPAILFDQLSMRKRLKETIRDTEPWKVDLNEFKKLDLFLSYDSACTSRKMFMTSAATVGSGPIAMDPGDLVCIFQGGGGTPIILRKQDNFYRLVGVAYVSGIMDGEAVTEWKRNNGSLQTFEIR
jgi:hypothetical protein